METVLPYISKSSATTESNRTGTWRFLRPAYAEKTAPCRAACPAGEPIARIEMLLARGDRRTALKALLMENPFPAVCGRVCFHPCETACNRSTFDEAVAVHHLERFVGGFGIREIALGCLPEIRRETGLRIAVAGSGPAGLSAAWFLRLLGFQCDLFEAAAEPGGILRWGIPEYRLPGFVLAAEIARIERLGIKIHCNRPIAGKDLENLRSRYDGVFIGCGQSRSLGLHIPGEEAARDGLELLRQARSGMPQEAPETAVVIGGGNTAVDVARTLVRLGSAVTIAYRRRRQDMPAFSPEITAALDEGVRIMEMAAPVRIDAEKTGLAVFLQPMTVVDTRADGRARVAPADDKPKILRTASVYMAIGAEAEAHWRVPAEKGDGTRLSHCSAVLRDQPLIHGGDLTNARRSVADAVASGKQAAMVLDAFFRSGAESIEPALDRCRIGGGPALSMDAWMNGRQPATLDEVVDFGTINTDYFNHRDRAALPMSGNASEPPAFSEPYRTYTAETASAEAARCFNCGVCNGCDNCRLFCPEVAVTAENGERRIHTDHCKGCGICVTECPRNAMVLEEEHG